MIAQIVKVVLVLYGLVACFFIFLLWRNASATDALKNAGIVFASILAGGFFVLPYLTPETIEKRLTYMLLFDSKQKTVIDGEERNNYFSAYLPMFTNLPRVGESLSADNWTDFMGNKGMDLIERGVLEKLLIKFSNGWDIVSQSKFKGPGFTSGSWSLGASAKKTEIPLVQLRKIFKHNQLISRPDVVVMPQIVLPPDSTLQTEQNDQARIIKISNQVLSIQINISPQMGGVQQQGIWGVQSPDPQDMNRYSAIFFRVSVIGRLGWARRDSPEMTTYRRWFDNLTEELSTLDWERIDSDIHETLVRKSISKILSQ